MLKGLVSLVTGGASGIGRETVKHLANQGACVVLADLPQSKGQDVANLFQKNVVFVPCDVVSEDDVSNALAECKKNFGGLDAAVNCAGVSRAFKIANPPTQNVMKLEEIEIVIKTNLYGTFNVMRLAAKLMSENEGRGEDKQRGVIINVGSVSSEDGMIGQAAYAASKGGVSSMTLPVARDLAPLGIRVVTIAPGLIDTPLTSDTCLTPKIKDYFIEQIPFPKRFGKPTEFAQLVQSVISNHMLNGVILKMSGGLRFHVDIRVPKL